MAEAADQTRKSLVASDHIEAERAHVAVVLADLS